jgi:hypothetical protein
MTTHSKDYEDLLEIPKNGGCMTILACPKCGLNLMNDDQRHCKECARKSRKRMILFAAVLLPVCLSMAAAGWLPMESLTFDWVGIYGASTNMENIGTTFT